MQFLLTLTVLFYHWLIYFIAAVHTDANHPSAIVNEFYDKRLSDDETWLTADDFNRARIRRDIFITFGDEPVDVSVNDSAMYNKKRFEGDIVNPGLNSKTVNGFVVDESAAFVNGMPFTTNIHSKIVSAMRNAVRSSYLRWPNGRIPYTVSKQYSAFGRGRIAEAIKEYSEKTCIQFVPKIDTDIDYVHIFPDDGCYSLVGKVGGKQPVSLGEGCVYKGIIIHELMHAVGFFHEQSRADRDQYIKIKWENVEHGLEDQFDKYSLAIIDHLGTEYDYGSVMHYGPNAFSVNGQPTIEPIQTGAKIGQRIGFSPTDLYKINKLYNCPNAETSPPKPGNSLDNIPPPTTPNLLSLITIPSGSTTVNIISSPPPPNKPIDINNNCIDLLNDCEALAASGHCESVFSSAFMAVNCMRSCEKCGGFPLNPLPPVNNCHDRRTWCPGWAASGLCDFSVFQQYMHAKCARSCGVCQ